MKRRKFLQFFGIGTTAIITAPKLLKPTEGDKLAKKFHEHLYDAVLPKGEDGSIYVALHDSEKALEYGRVAVERSGENWGISSYGGGGSGGTVVASNKKVIQFPTCNAGEYNIDEVWLMTEDDDILFKGPITQGGKPVTLHVSEGITPAFGKHDIKLEVGEVDPDEFKDLVDFIDYSQFDEEDI